MEPLRLARYHSASIIRSRALPPLCVKFYVPSRGVASLLQQIIDDASGEATSVATLRLYVVLSSAEK